MSRKGFTLIELTIVIAVLIILLSIIVPSVMDYINNSESVASEANAKSAYSAALQVAMTNKNNPGRLEDIPSAENAIKEILGNGVTVTVSTTAPGALANREVHILIDEGIPIAAYYQESKYPSDSTAGD